MIDATALECSAMQACLKPFGEAAGQIGFDKPLGTYSQEQALFVIEAIVTAYVDEMAAQHEATKYPAVRIPAAAVVHDPMRATQPTQASTDNPMADLKDDLPWETPAEGKP